MAEFSDDVKALRILLAEQGVEITLDRLLEILEQALDYKTERDCPECMKASFGLCFSCLKTMAEED